MNKITIVTYHYVREIKKSEYPKLKGLEFEKFKKQLDYLEKNYELITAQDLIECSINKKTSPRKSLLSNF